MAKTELTVENGDEVIAKIDNVSDTVNDKCLELIGQRLCELGVKAAQGAYWVGTGDGNDDISVAYNKTDEGYEIRASGESVCFAEFGTGVYAGSYPGEIPEGVNAVPGGWSQTHGKGNFVPGTHEFWFWDGQRYVGTIPRPGMALAVEEIEASANAVATEVLTSAKY